MQLLPQMSQQANGDGNPASTPFAHILAYRAPNITATIFTIVPVMFVPAFYTRERGVSLATVGVALLAARIWDAFVDPLIGSLSDRATSRTFGRKPWLIVSGALLIAFTFLLFVPLWPAAGWSLFLCLLLWYTSYSAFLIPYMAWGTELSQQYRTRGLLIGIREILGILGFLAIILWSSFTAGDTAMTPGQSLHLFAHAVLFVLPVAIAVAWVPSGTRPPKPEHSSGHLRDIFNALVHNPAYLRIMLAHTLVIYGTSMFGALLLIYIEIVLMVPKAVNLYYIFMFTTAVILYPIPALLSPRLANHRVLALGMAFYAVVFAYLAAIPAGNVPFLLIGAVMIGVPHMLVTTSGSAIISDTTDYYALRTGRWQPGVLLSGFIFSLKLATGLGAATALLLVDLAGFQPMGSNDAQSITWFRIIAFILPALVVAVGAWLTYGYPIDARRHAIIRRRIETRSARQ